MNGMTKNIERSRAILNEAIEKLEAAQPDLFVTGVIVAMAQAANYALGELPDGENFALAITIQEGVPYLEFRMSDGEVQIIHGAELQN